MSVHSHSTSIFLWCVQPMLQLVVAAVLWRRKIHRQFPVFFSFLLAQIAIFAATFPVYGRNDTWYFWLFWIGEAVNAVLGFKVIHEIFLDVFRPYYALRDLGTPVFKWAGMVMLLVSVVVAASNSFTQYPLIHAVTTLERSVRTVQVGLILFLVIFARFLGVSRKQISFGIALGFGLFAATDLALYALYSGRFVGRSIMNLISMSSYDLSIVVWLAYSSLAAFARATAANQLRTQRWEQGLAELQRPMPNDSLIPMFETMVERAFSRSSSLESVEDHVQRPGRTQTARVKTAAAGLKSSG